jgi:hypothetical protein
MEENNNKNNNKGLIIVVIIMFVACAILTSIMVKFGKALSKRVVETIKDTAQNQDIFDIVEHKQENLIYSEEFELTDIKNVNLKTVAATITVKESKDDKVKIEVFSTKEKEVTANVLEDTISVEYLDQEEHNFTINIGINEVQDEMIVYIPKDYENNILTDTNYGNISFDVSLKNASIDIVSDYGNIDIESVKNISIDCDFGNINVKNVYNKLDIETEYGNVNVDNLEINEDSNIVTKYGNVNVEKTNDIRIDTDVSLGSVDVNKNNKEADVTLNIKSEMGFINVN